MKLPDATPPSRQDTPWAERNQRWLMQALGQLRARLDVETPEQALGAPTDDDTFVPALERCCTLFGLSTFERELLLLVAGVELDDALRQSVMRAHARISEGSRLAQPTFSLAFGVLSEPHWDALSPLSPLRRWRLVELDGPRSPALTPLFIDERILHFLTGVASVEPRLRGLARVTPAPEAAESPQLGERIARALSKTDARAPLALLTQQRADPDALRAAANDTLAGARAAGLWLSARDLPADPAELADAALLVDREAALAGALPILELDAGGEQSAERDARCVTLLSHLLGPALLLGPCDPGALARLSQRRITRIPVPDARARALDAQAALPLVAARSQALDDALRPALQQFQLSAGALRGVLQQLGTDASDADTSGVDAALAGRVWRACREAARGGLDALAQRVESEATFDDLVLPPAQVRLLSEIGAHLRLRPTVYDAWGMGGRSTRGQGLCVLFAGESGTGKTLAAEAIANATALDLYRIDLATVVSKYIGETEKNLKRVFDAAEASGAVLLFDEADALFGKRSDVKDSHDRYANIEVAYLLQRIEVYRGLAILTTNFRSALDRAFLRRIRFIVQFPFPDEAAREQIWRRELPATAPLRDVDFAALARMQLAGGHIRSVALNAGFMAAGAGEPIDMTLLRHAAQREAAKLERPLGEAARKAW